MRGFSGDPGDPEATLFMDVENQNGYLVVRPLGDAYVRGWVTHSPHPSTGQLSEGLFIPLDIARASESFEDSPESPAGGSLAPEPWPEREERVGTPRLGCAMVAVSALAALGILYVIGSWLAS